MLKRRRGRARSGTPQAASGTTSLVRQSGSSIYLHIAFSLPQLMVSTGDSHPTSNAPIKVSPHS